MDRQAHRQETAGRRSLMKPTLTMRLLALCLLLLNLPTMDE